LKRIFRRGLKLFFAILFILLIATMVQVILLRFIDPPFTARLAWNWLQDKFTARQIEQPDYRWRPLSEISPHLKRAVLAGEDQRFMSHRGLDFVEMTQAVRDILSAKRVRGASTITMQVARTVFLWKGRSLWRKIAEAYYTALVEICWPKERIFEIYLNTVEWGTNIMGAEAAARRYYRTSSLRLTSYQAAMLAAILPNPHTWSPAHPNKRVRRRQEKIMKDMVKMPLL
jgi:monofunctional biosynthetic peptidoglycan transglycosylase